MSEPDEKSADEDVGMWLWRGYSIGAYSMLEQSLCQVFKKLMGTTDYRAAVVFFQIYNARARNKIIEKLIKDHFESEFNPSWNCIFKYLKQIDDARNSIAHWAMIYKFSTSLPIRPVPDYLVTPNIWASMTGGGQTMNIDDLQAFVRKTEVFGALIGRFADFVIDPNGERDAALVDAWHDIFRTELVYPLPDDHLLFQISHTEQTPPQSSQD